MLYYMNSNTALVIFAMVAMLGLATATVVIPYIPQVQAVGNPGFGACFNGGTIRGHFGNSPHCL